MGTIFTISPFILKNSLPRRGTIASIISNNFHLFNVFSTNPCIVRAYMDFIDENFDNAFRKLGYTIISYDYPDKLDDFEMIDYINDKYKLSGDRLLDICYQINICKFNDYISGQEKEMYFNDYAYYDIGILENWLFDVDDQRLITTLNLIEYLYYKNDYDTLKLTIYKIIDYISSIEDGITDYFSSSYVCDATMTLFKLKNYISNKVKEEGD